MFPSDHITSHKPMFHIFWGNDTHFKKLANATTFSLPFQTQAICVYISKYLYIKYIHIYMYVHTHTHTCLTKFSNVQGVGHSYLRKGVLPRSRNMTHRVNKGKSCTGDCCYESHVNQQWCESSKKSPGSTGQELTVFVLAGNLHKKKQNSINFSISTAWLVQMFCRGKCTKTNQYILKKMNANTDHYLGLRSNTRLLWNTAYTTEGRQGHKLVGS